MDNEGNVTIKFNDIAASATSDIEMAGTIIMPMHYFTCDRQTINRKRLKTL